MAKKTRSPLPRRPSNIPASAEWVEEWKQWGEGPREGGKRNGMWKCWRPDGSLQEETWFQDDVPHGSVTRFHPDGSLAQKSTFEHGRPREARLFLTDKETDEPHDKHPAPIRELHVMFDEKGRQTSIARFDAKGRLRKADGRPAPPRPANVPPEAYFVPGGDVFKIGSFATPAEGLTIEWDFSGKARKR